MSSSKFKILIVDDTPKNIQVLGSFLKKEGYQTGFALNGKQALLSLEKSQFDLVLLDIMMPGMDGYTTCIEIRKNQAWKDIPIIYLTAKNDADSIIRGFELGGQDYITKPFNSKELLCRVKTHLELKQAKAELTNLNEKLEEKVAQRTIELLDAYKELKKLDSAKNDFLGLINYELRAPMTSITGCVSILDKFDFPENVSELIDIVKTSSSQLEQFSYKVLDISLMQTKGKDALFQTNCFISSLIQQTIESLQEKLDLKNIAININPLSSPIEIKVDEKKFKKTLNYILDNAIKYSENNSSIEINYNKVDDDIEIDIKDQGIGFTEEDLKKVFQPFSNIKNHNEKGSGLSLFYAKVTAETHDGKIMIIPNQPQGSIVRISVPVSKPVLMSVQN